MRSIRTLLCTASMLLLLPAATVSAQDRAARQAAASELLTLMRMDETVIQGALTMLDAQIRAEPVMENFREVMESFMREALAWKNVGPRLVALYAETYTEPELRAIMTFYRTPAGQRLLETQSELMTRAAAIGESEVGSRQAELERRLQRRAAELEGRASPF